VVGARARERAERRRVVTIYFIGSRTGHIKIGYTGSDSPADRLASLQTGNPTKLEILGQCPGDQGLERQLHQQFRDLRTTGEWFRSDKTLLSLLAFVKAYGSCDGWTPTMAVVPFRAFAGRIQDLPAEDPLLAAVRRIDRRSGRAERKPNLDRALTDHWDFQVELRSTHRINPERSFGNCVETSWCEGNGHFLDGTGLATTALALAATDHDPVKNACVWIQAALHESDRRFDRDPTLSDLFPMAPWLYEATHGQYPVDYHHRVTRTLPRSIHLPARALLSIGDFVEIVSVHRASLQHLLLETWYLENWNEPIKRSARAA
jgi:Meiotically up-regulated gene 113